MSFQWFGWPGIDVHRSDRDTIRQEVAERYKAVPVFLSKETANDYYTGFCNQVLSPSLHDMPREVNEIFADYIVPHVENGDLIWILDYHLLLLLGTSANDFKKGGCDLVGLHIKEYADALIGRCQAVLE
ncbi:hypothetical protein LTR47_011309 [Exophiala xenobiotica]|nr:hypothetical protein LTR72_011227 [Exophiala xenobiotica]KAK5220254.1 hypothetical protein LTR47_011309 [Exophiala xenobiotica]KAK5244422.1 hypothetical protein LTS06_010001 [Exophiala xenobiotica]KAK5282450.1 Trehalose-6-P synthase/phosphatase complex subunit [Exophiala xenobiotica]KAK5285225.1 hypothetical protein LTR14_011135 [Exophiala xenobiotica]